MTVNSPRPKKYAKPLSLHPLKFEDAVSALLKVKPEPKAETPKKSVQKMDKGT
jgi:hypothetical protein